MANEQEIYFEIPNSSREEPLIRISSKKSSTPPKCPTKRQEGKKTRKRNLLLGRPWRTMLSSGVLLAVTVGVLVLAVFLKKQQDQITRLQEQLEQLNATKCLAENNVQTTEATARHLALMDNRLFEHQRQQQRLEQQEKLNETKSDEIGLLEKKVKTMENATARNLAMLENRFEQQFQQLLEQQQKLNETKSEIDLVEKSVQTAEAIDRRLAMVENRFEQQFHQLLEQQEKLNETKSEIGLVEKSVQTAEAMERRLAMMENRFEQQFHQLLEQQEKLNETKSEIDLVEKSVQTVEDATARHLAMLEKRFEQQFHQVRPSPGLLGSGGNMPVGTILPFAGEKIPDGWMLCDGRFLYKDEYKEMYAIISNRFNLGLLLEDLDRQFQLPDLRGRTIVGAGVGINGQQHFGLLTQRKLGEYLGVEQYKLTIKEMPSHNHGINDPGHLHAQHPDTWIDWPRGFNEAGGGRGIHFFKPKYTGQNVNVQASTTGITLQSAGSSQPHENMQPSAVVNFIIKVGAVAPLLPATTTIAIPTVAPWPKSDKIIGFWPLNSNYTIYDVSKNRFNGASAITILNRLASGPFGGNNTAVEPVETNSKILEVANGNVKVEESFTIALFFKRGNARERQEGGIFEFIDMFNTSKAFQFRYVNRTTIQASANGRNIGEYTMVQQNGVWTFIAFVFDSETTKLTVYGRHGVVSSPKRTPELLFANTFNNAGVRLGWASKWKQGLQRGDAVSCLMIYSAVLDALEIRQAYDACRAIHNSPPCGSPKLPLLAPIPAATSFTTILKPGQFPFIASVHSGNRHICSASIIDQYWLLSAATCFQESNVPSAYTVYVGEYDLSVEEGYTRKHSVSKIILPNVTIAPRDIALIEVAEPIDFTSDYVNDVCLFKNSQLDEVKFDMTQFVFGWGGKNNRQSIGHYVLGKTMTDSQCIQAWGAESYVPSKDFCFLSASHDKNVPCTRGDKGSPLLLQAHSKLETGHGNRLVQVGVFYARDANCTLLPPIFSNVAHYSTWIAEKIACAVPGVIYPDKCPQ